MTAEILIDKLMVFYNVFSMHELGEKLNIKQPAISKWKKQNSVSAIKKKFKLSKHDEEERPMLNRLALHSYCLKFADAGGNEFNLVAELPKDMRALLQQLKKNN